MLRANESQTPDGFQWELRINHRLMAACMEQIPTPWGMPLTDVQTAHLNTLVNAEGYGRSDESEDLAPAPA